MSLSLLPSFSRNIVFLLVTRLLFSHLVTLIWESHPNMRRTRHFVTNSGESYVSLSSRKRVTERLVGNLFHFCGLSMTHDYCIEISFSLDKFFSLIAWTGSGNNIH
jgi:hypothetical protein